MAKKEKKYYTVWKGRQTGVFDNWEDCQKAVLGFPGAMYKSFPSQAEALKAFHTDLVNLRLDKSEATSAPKLRPKKTRQWIVPSISVDAACSGNPGVMEYRAVDTQSGKEIFRQGPFPGGTNNVGEFLALVHTLALLKKHHKEDIPIYSDSKIAIQWVNQKKCNTKLAKTAANAVLFDMVAKAETWLQLNQWKNPIIKWETKIWGEIPADFGRKK